MPADRRGRLPFHQDHHAIDPGKVLPRRPDDGRDERVLARASAAESLRQRSIPVEVQGSLVGPVRLEELRALGKEGRVFLRGPREQLAVDGTDLVLGPILHHDVAVLRGKAVRPGRAEVEVDPAGSLELRGERNQARRLVVAVGSHAANVEEGDHDGEAAPDPDGPPALKPVHERSPSVAPRAAITRDLRAPSPGWTVQRSWRSRGSCIPEDSWPRLLAAPVRTRASPQAPPRARAR